MFRPRFATPRTVRAPLRAWVLAALATIPIAAPSSALAAPDPAPVQDGAPQGVLRISASVPGATVWIDDQDVGPAPVTRYVAPGPHQVRVAADNHNPFVRRVDVDPDRTVTLSANLLKGTGTVEFGTPSPGATVELEGGQESPLPVRLTSIGPGTYRYTIRAPGFEPLEGEFTFAAGKNIYLFKELEKSAGLLVVDARPDGASVELDGTTVGTSPLRQEGLPPGPHLITVRHPDHPTVYKVVDTSDGSKAAVGGRLPEKGGTVTIRTGSAAGQVSMAGTVLGTGRKVVLKDVARGRYPVEVMRPEFKPAVARVVSPPQGRRTYKLAPVTEGERGNSALIELPPWYARWQVWTVAGVGVAAGVTATTLIILANQPEPIPDGDVTVSLP